MVDKAAVAGVEGFVEFASGLETGVVHGGSGEEQVVDEGLFRFAQGSQGDTGAKGMGLDVEAVNEGAESVDQLKQIARGIVGGVSRDGEFRPPPAGPRESDDKAVVRRADNAGGFHAGLQFGIGADDIGQRVAVAVDEDANMAIPGLGLEVGYGKVLGIAGCRVVAELQIGGEEFVGVEVFAATGKDHGNPPARSVALKQTAVNGTAAGAFPCYEKCTSCD